MTNHLTKDLIHFILFLKEILQKLLALITNYNQHQYLSNS